MTHVNAIGFEIITVRLNCRQAKNVCRGRAVGPIINKYCTYIHISIYNYSINGMKQITAHKLNNYAS